MINLNTNLTFNKAMETVHYYTTPYKKGKLKGKTPLETCQEGFTSYSNAVKVLEEMFVWGVSLIYLEKCSQ